MPDQVITLELPYVPPYQWEHMLGFLDMRAIGGVECVRDGKYWRTVRLFDENGAKACGWLCVENMPDANALHITLSSSLCTVLDQIETRLSCLFDLACDPQEIAAGLASMRKVHPALPISGLRVPGCFDPFEMSSRAVLGQQISVKAASTLAARMVETLGDEIDTGIEGLTHAFPLPETIASTCEEIESVLGPLGIIKTRARLIYDIACNMNSGRLSLSPSSDAEEQMELLLALKGVGPWTAQYVAMRTMAWPDSFLETDIGVKEALPNTTPKERIAISQAWRPWRSYAVLNLWTSLSL